MPWRSPTAQEIQPRLRESGLRIDHGVVALRGDVCPEFADFAPRRRAPPRAAPAPQPHRITRRTDACIEATPAKGSSTTQSISTPDACGHVR